MAIIHCPGCKKRISSINKTCPHCTAEIGGSGEGRDPEMVERHKKIARKGIFQAQMYLSILVTVAGFTWMWHSSDGLATRPGNWPIAMMGIGALWYVVVRIYMMYVSVKERG